MRVNPNMETNTRKTARSLTVLVVLSLALVIGVVTVVAEPAAAIYYRMGTVQDPWVEVCTGSPDDSHADICV